jgi:hypothetical protein
MHQTRNVAQLRSDGSWKHGRRIAADRTARVDKQLGPKQLAGSSDSVLSRQRKLAGRVTQPAVEAAPHRRGQVGIVPDSYSRRVHLVSYRHYLLSVCL